MFLRKQVIQIKENKGIKISVRNLVEFILRSGNLDNRQGGWREEDAMQQGSRIHRKIQKKQGADYQAEVSLKITVPIPVEAGEVMLSVEGRADGIITKTDGVVIDEIKAIYMDLSYLEAPVKTHLAQVMCYAYIVAKERNLEQIGTRITYCNIETEDIRYFDQNHSMEELTAWFHDLTEKYGKWMQWQMAWNQERDQSIQELIFPFPYRKGQKELVKGVYQTILRKKKLFIEAPTGVGKTIATVYPSLKSISEGLTEKIFYLTAKTITRTVAENTFRFLKGQGLCCKVVMLTAKEKICVLEKSDCNPVACERANGHFDRVNDAVFDLLTSEHDISRDLILEYAEKHKVCPFEMSLDVTNWADTIICDYNYVFDPAVYLKRFFAEEKGRDYVFLIDEAHNLVERAREMYSAVVYKHEFLYIKKITKEKSLKLSSALDKCNADLLKLKRDCDEFQIVDSIGDFILHLLHVIAELEDFFKMRGSTSNGTASMPLQSEEQNALLEFYFGVRHFMAMFEIADEKYVTYTDYDAEDNFRLTLQCMNPSSNLKTCLDKGRSAVFFSATLLPIQYYKEQLSGSDEDYAIYAPSSFSVDKRLLMVATDVSTKYTRRNRNEFEKIVHYMEVTIKAKEGNYMVFFPSYQMLGEILEIWIERNENDDIAIVAQHSSMTEVDKEEFLEEFESFGTGSKIGFCVMGGIFSEGIDLKEDRLIGAIIVGTGLPMVCNERELFRDYYEEKNNAGFAYAYLYQGMNKVLQSAGRVIRTSQDLGVILLLDERFRMKQYQDLFPREWFPHLEVNKNNVLQAVEDFWKGHGD